MHALSSILSGCRAALLLVVFAWASTSQNAQAQMPWTGMSSYYGDLNNDRLVDDADMAVLNADFASGAYVTRSDLNRDGIVNQLDAGDLTRAIAFAREGPGEPSIKIPQFYFSELRWGNPNSQSLFLQARFLEFGVTAQPKAAPFSGTFPTGVYYIAIGKEGSGQAANQGIILKVEDLAGMAFGTLGGSLDRCLVIDPISADSFPFTIPATSPINLSDRSLGDFAWEDMNISHYLVYRRPTALDPAYTSPLARPEPGQDIATQANPCEIDPRTGVVGDQLPPWDLVIDAFTTVRSSNPGAPAIFGCLYAQGDSYQVGPDGFFSAPYHAWRCEPFGTWRFNSPLATGADTPGSTNLLCNPENFCGSTVSGSCTTPHSGPFCSDIDCCNWVCSQDAACCTLSWDSSCAGLAAAGCTSCGGLGTGSCFDVHVLSNCDDLACCTLVCLQAPECCFQGMGWDANCVELARAECLSCGSSVPGPCDTVHAYPSCSDAECCTVVCSADPACCALTWDQSCVDGALLLCSPYECGSQLAGSCCLSHSTPGCRDAFCCQFICTMDAYCCEVRWDVVCAMLADTECGLQCACGPIETSGGPVSLSCFATHYSPGCGDWGCCDTICNADPFCCAVSWDEACVAVANHFCSSSFADVCGYQLDNIPLAASCVVPHPWGGCEDGGCCDSVCSLFPECCTVIWDEACVAVAIDICERCGEALTESCFSAHGSPNCNATACCDAVCAIDPFCCSDEWDSVCVKQAIAVCGDPIEACGGTTLRPCEVSSGLPGCSNAACCTDICTNYDSYCCDVVWDAICVQQTMVFCPDVQTGGRGDCLQVHEQIGCGNPSCTATVCSVDVACCVATWDQSCVNAAEALCIAVNLCPGVGSKTVVHPTPGCADTACCNAVCLVDPTCCSEAWDAACVQAALVQCATLASWECPCFGDPFSIHSNPGSDDASCCAIVCQLDPGCCIDGWDEQCVVIARDRCCGAIGCGSGCNGDCFTEHNSPYCADPFCCSAVCAEDPYCCIGAWDGFCAEIASVRCSGCGTDSVQMGCFTEHIGRGCNIDECCTSICGVDPYCCETVWDATCAASAGTDADCTGARAECGAPLLGEPCIEHLDVGCNDEQCCDAVCLLDPYCCTYAWDGTCVDLALANSSCPCAKDCGDACAGECCEPHAGPSCDNEECCGLVCAADAFCCATEWDEVCASSARALCYATGDACPYTCGIPGSKSCCVIHIGATCDNEACCSEVCAVDIFCCVQSWDSACVAHAAKMCGDLCSQPSLFCGSAIAGSCSSTHSTPFCNDKLCCSQVCMIAPECCEASWDAYCVSIALKLCN
ncbi:MAG: hypothetical protein O2800_01860 [Planctomycetota bacterium]|nr:hypothetical protein [Planctomycetota bacterium]